MSYTRSTIYALWLSELKADLIKAYKSSGLEASGEFEKQLEAVATNDKAILYGAYHSQFMELGRRKTEKGPAKGEGKLTDIILKWIDDKRITPKPGTTKKALAFLIARKIHKEGIKVPNKYNAGGVISKVITEERISELISQLKFVEVEQITSDIMNLIKAA